MSPEREPDDTLWSWDDVRTWDDWSALLIGNGFSRNIWERFGYASLFDRASSEEIGHRLTEADLHLFKRLATHNFEGGAVANVVGIWVTRSPAA